MLPSCFGNLTSMQILDLSHNQLSGNLAWSPLTRLTALEELLLSDNHFDIPISLVSFFNHSKLKVVEGANNRLGDQVEFQSRVPRFQLQVFVLSNCWSNKSDLKFPHFLYHQYDLGTVDISHNSLVGTFPIWLLENNTLLEVLSLRNNSLTGPFLLPSHPNPHASIVDISGNHFDGQVPTNIGLIFPNLWILNMATNLFEGQIPPSLGDLHSLQILDLSKNNFSGPVPEHLAIGCSSLSFLRLSNNNLSGQIYPALSNLTHLEFLYLDNNQFEGKLPNSLSTLTLSVLDVSNNHISGKLPGWIGNMRRLKVIMMLSNHFEGPIPVEFCKLDDLEFLDLSDNHLSGFVPSCFNSSSIKHVHLNQNNLRGPWTHAFDNCSSLVTIDLSDNNLSGTIPGWIGRLSSLNILILKFNQFEGKIPGEICKLKSLSLLDLSQNKFSGLIPPCFSDIPFNPTDQYSFRITTTGITIAGRFQRTSVVVVGSPMPSGEHRRGPNLDYEHQLAAVQNQVEFTTKHMSYTYKRIVLVYMSGIDLSCNHLSGEIPPGTGYLGEIHALNLSHNNLTGSIPTTFSQLKQVESLDLSYNSLNGGIPHQLIELNRLAVFSVAHNNLSGATPGQKAQFLTFEESSYEGNPLLCGFPLHNSCTPTSTVQKDQDEEGEDGGFVDMEAFYVSFSVSYVIVLLATVAVLIINPQWRRVWFQFVEVCMTSCYYFALDSFRKVLNKRSV
ncbi:Protein BRASSINOSTEROID INSENSITIVE 1 like [Actinidia chinensis var. chinensis]|uniref:Protein BRASSINOSTEROID INSENSITIVE 1 like n=1 Tax=Actinidia chinensis var. chinensis TaxID=1590841 RepID=A0A2R6S1K3_ACTCC|nr:Protein BRASSINOSTEROID INSENSITIVE 1 like [Actinidia chinensis var. chinensis]